MGESIINQDYLEQQMNLPEVDLRQYSPLTLAYIGDGVFELIIRTIMVQQENCPVQKLHRRTSTLVKAENQAEMIDPDDAVSDGRRADRIPERKECQVLYQGEECIYRNLSQGNGIRSTDRLSLFTEEAGTDHRSGEDRPGRRGL